MTSDRHPRALLQTLYRFFRMGYVFSWTESDTVRKMRPLGR